MVAAARLPRFARFALGFCGSIVLLLVAVSLREIPQAASADLPPLETRLLGQSRWLTGGPAALRVIVSDHRTNTPVRAGIEVALTPLVDGTPRGTPQRLYRGRTDQLGTVEAQFTAPKGKPGAYQLTVSIDSPLGADEVVQQIQLEESVQVMLTADKPLYQPGQTMHLRALALDLATRAAVSGKTLVFEVEDARGNKVFKKREALSDFGIAGADFTLADEVNPGTYTLRAILPEGQAEKKVRVERYVLPKFKVALTTAKPYYLPGEVVRGTVQADYFFGKAVAGGEVIIEVSTVDIGVSKLAELKGKTDAHGAFAFEYALPAHFVGQPFEQGKAVVEFHGMIIDTAEHMQQVHTRVPVVKEPVLLVIVPESRTLAPGVVNRVFIAAATPDGRPLQGAQLRVSTNLTRTIFSLTTDDYGLATFEFTPRREPVTITARATNADGQTAIVTQTLDAAPAEEGIILRASQSLAKVGDRVNVAVVSSAKSGTIYLDVIRNKQTILTKAMPAEHGQASLRLSLTEDMVGTLEIHAYKILPNEDIIRDAQLLIVTPADDLTITVDADKTQYRPGEEAKLTFSVTDTRRHPILAALGLAIVDESVFALSELQPGLEKIYFMLERELMEPKYEIHGLKPVDLVLGEPEPAPAPEEARQRAAAALFAAVPRQGEFDLRVNTYQQRWEKLKETVIAEMVKAHETITQAVNRYQRDTNTTLTGRQGLFLLVEKGYLKVGDLRDRWGNFYRSDVSGDASYNWFTLSCAGPDGRWGTADDLAGVHRHRFGGFDGRRRALGEGNAFMEMEAMPMKAMADMAMAKAAVPLPPSEPGAPAAEPVRIREYFPETMYWNPAIITDEHGKAEIRVPVADSITTWRMSAVANSARGQLGSMTAPLRVFQDFFVDIDLPIAFTQHDRAEVPVAVYNYLPGAQRVTLTMEEDTWFTIDGPATREVEIAKDEVKVVYFPITVQSIGRFPLTVTAKGTTLSDAIRRSIDVLPDGKEIRETINDRLEGKVEKTMTIPENAIDGASTIFVKLYPGAFSQVAEGLDGILRMPSGCFEQTSSTTYPNVLVLDYLKENKRINPELQMKAEQYINVGYQRLVTYEVPGGGFSWFGNAPAHQILTAYGLLQFSDMAMVQEVDPALISRTQQWLAEKQRADGTWEVKEQGIAEGIINRQTGALRATAYIAWTLAESGYRGPQVAKAVQYVRGRLNEAKDPYTLAVILNLLTCVDREGNDTAKVAQALMELAKTTEKTAYWESEMATFTGARAKGADLETSGLAAYGLAKWGRNSGFLTKALTHLVQSKDSFGTWESTQGTVWAMKALLYAGKTATGGGNGTVTVRINGTRATTFTITAEDSDVMRQVDLASYVREGGNTITLDYDGDGSLLYQIVGRYYLPWAAVRQAGEAAPPLTINVAYNKTTLAQDDTATVTVTVKNTARPRATVEMPLIDVGVPPGFTVMPEALEAAVAAKTISKYTLAARQIIIYLEKLGPDETVTLTYRLKAKYPLRARTPQSRAYPYYNPEQAAVSVPQQLTVRK